MSAGEIVIVCVVALIGILLVVELIALTALLVAMKNLAQEMRDRVEPLMTKADAILAATRDVAETVNAHADTVAENTVRASNAATGLVESLTKVLRYALLRPLITLLSTVQGVAAGVDAAKSAAGDEDAAGAPSAAEPHTTKKTRGPSRPATTD